MSPIMIGKLYTNFRRRLKRWPLHLSIAILILLITAGIFAKNGWFPSTDLVSGKRSGWFGKPIARNAPSSWNPLPMPSPTPQLSKELIYAGSRLLASEDKNANAAPPADLAVWRPSSGTWYVLGVNGQTTYGYGANGDTPVQGDYDGDGKTDFAVVRPASGSWDWYIAYSAGGSAGFTFGVTSDTPVIADYDGDGKSDPALFRPSTRVWYIMRSSDSTTISPQYGNSGDVPAQADFDGDGKTDLTVFRGSNTTFYTTRSSDSGSQSTSFGNSGDKPVSADYDGDGKANYALRHNADWLIRNAALTSTTTTTPSGDASNDIPVQNDYDGDGIVDIAVWRDSNGTWYIRKSGSSGALRQEQWGYTGDIPVPAYFRR